MSLNIKYNADGSITVECGDEAVDILPQGTRPPKQTGTPNSGSGQPAIPTTGSPRTGPRVMVRIPGYSSDKSSAYFRVLSSAIGLKAFLSPGKRSAPGVQITQRPVAEVINLKILPSDTIDVKTLVDRVQKSRGTDRLDLQLWMMPKDAEE